jgi:sterol desaturase/sphingolipid hydroxylase (fatty acid hydroxylase superfamily)
MQDTLIIYEAPLRAGAFLIVFALLAVWEILAPRRTPVTPKAKRWLANLGILIINTTIVRVALPAAAVGIAIVAEQHGVGLLHAINLPYPVAVLLAVVALDLAIYLQHVMFHAVPLLWRLHRAHHADLDFDVTTGTRFHPIEMVLSIVIKTAVIFVLGAPVLAVFIFETLLNISSMFNHSNIRISEQVDKFLRLVVVTPDMHRVHHSIDGDETNRNFGFNLPWWDHLFGTYQAQPRSGHEQMLIGIPAFREPQRSTTLIGILSIPFVKGYNDQPTIHHDVSYPAGRAP